MEVSFPQLANAYEPIEVTVFGIVTDINLSQSQNAYAPIVVTPLGIVKDTIEHR